MKRAAFKRRPPAGSAAKAPVRESVFARDGYRCLLAPRMDLPGCFGGLTPHHLRKGGQGGSYARENLVSLCSWHNAWVEDHGDAAWALGLVCRNGETLDEAWGRLRAAGLVPIGAS